MDIAVPCGMRLNICIALIVALASCSDDSGSLTVENHSDFTIVDIRLTQIDNPDFGPNLLAGDVLFPGESITLDTGCDTFDARVIDETGATCELFDLDLCLNDAVWVLTNSDCPVFTAAAKQRAASEKVDASTKK